jgi:competence protein ComEC
VRGDPAAVVAERWRAARLRREHRLARSWLPRLDARLLAPAVLAWAGGAATLGAPAGLRLCVGVGCASLGALVLWRPRSGRAVRGRSHGRSHGWSDGRSPSTARRTLVGFLTASLLVTGLVLVASGAHGLVRDASGMRGLADDRAVVTVEGVVSREPVRVAARGAPTWLVGVDVTGLTAHGRASGAHASVLVLGDERWADLTWHAPVRVTGRLVPADDPASAEIAQLRPLTSFVSAPPESWVLRASDAARAGLRRASARLPPDARGLLPSLVVGDTSRLPQPLLDDMRTTGLTHLAAVSGTNTSLVLLMVLSMAGWVGCGRRLRALVGILGLAGFVVLARPEPSVVRAAVMGAIGVAGLVTNRSRAGPTLLGGAIVVLLVLDPWLARSYGFVLSALATLGLLLFARPWADAVDRRLPARLRGLGVALAVPSAASLLCAPVIVLLQGAVSLVGIVANAFAAPLVLPATVAGVAATVLSPLGDWATLVPAWVGGLACLGLSWVAHRFASVPFATIPWPDGAGGALGLAALSLAVVLGGRWAWDHLERRPVPVLGSLVVLVCAFAPVRPALWPPAGWVFVACDVGQGDALVVRSGADRAVLVDAGPDPAQVDGCLDRLGIHSLDAVVLTHFHADHIDGLEGALEGRPTRLVLTTPVRDPPEGSSAVARIAAAHEAPVTTTWSGDDLSLGQVQAHVLWPSRRITSGSIPNNSSVVLDVHVAGLRLLLLGDVEHEADAAIAGTIPADGPAFDVVKVAHHGSANLDGALWQRIHGRFAVVSVGADNDYGHPAPSTMTMLAGLGYAVWRTDRHGDVAIAVSDGRVGVTGRLR